MPKSRRLRRLVLDGELLERRAAGESLRSLAADYGVVHSTLLRYFRRPQVVLELREADRRLAGQRKAARAKRKAESEREQQARRRGRSARAQRALERQLEQEVRKRAEEDAERDRALEDWTPPKRATAYEAFFDRHEAPRGLASWELYSANDRKAAEVVSSGGGVQQVIEVTGLSWENVLRTIDAQILVRALENDPRRPTPAPPPRELPRSEGLRRLEPDLDLLSRRAAGSRSAVWRPTTASATQACLATSGAPR
jgi:hypothetical protein